MIIKRTPLAALAASALLLLAGCSGGGAPAADQSKADACDIVKTQFEEVSKAGSSMSSSDPEAAMTSFKSLATNVDDAFSSITNTEVAPAAAQASGALNDYVAFLEGVVADPSGVDGLGEQVQTLQQSFTDAAAVCAD